MDGVRAHAALAGDHAERSTASDGSDHGPTAGGLTVSLVMVHLSRGRRFPSSLPAERSGCSVTQVFGMLCHLPLNLQASHRDTLAAQGIATQHSLIAILTDGEPTAEPHERMEEAAEAVMQAEAKGGFTFLPIAVEGGNMNTLRKLCSRRPPLGLDQVDFDTFFDWLLVSLREASVSQPGERIKVKNPIKSPENPEGWGYFWFIRRKRARG